MRPDRQVATWPFLLILAALFVISVMAPRSWEKVARREPIAAAPTAVKRDAKRDANLAMYGVGLDRQLHVAPSQLATDEIADAPALRSWPHHDYERGNDECGFAYDVQEWDLPLEPMASRQSPIASGLPAFEDLAFDALLNGAIYAQRWCGQAYAIRAHAIDFARDFIAARWKSVRITLAERPTSSIAADAVSASPSLSPIVPPRDRQGSYVPPSDGPLEHVPGEPRLPAAPKQPAAPLVPEPFALVRELEKLSLECSAGDWPLLALERVRELTRVPRPSLHRAASLLDALTAQASPDHPSVARLGQDALAVELRRAQHALGRRVRLWRRFLVDPNQAVEFLTRLEAYETSGMPHDARQLAIAHCARRAVDAGCDAGGLVEESSDKEWDGAYRNTNLRLAISADLLNRLLPPVAPITSPVRERILGVPTRGTSTATTRLQVELLPGEQRIRLVLRAFGDVAASTRSKSGPATVFTDSDATYAVERMIELRPDAWSSSPCKVDASTQPRLRGIRTDFDEIPVVGSLVQGFARYKFDQSFDEARREGERRIARQVSNRFDGDLDRRLKDLDALLDERLRATFERMNMRPRILEMRSDPERMVVRARVADEDQLAANTPRPMAPSNSLASMQIHQTAVNNLGERLNLGGNTYALPDLYDLLAEKLAQPIEAPDEVLDSDIEIRFAKENPLVVQFVEGRIELALQIAELRNEDLHWHDFSVRVGYKPEITAGEARLVRDGSIVVSGRSLRRPQIILRSIFNKAFSPNKPLVLVQGKLSSNKRFDNLRINQCELIDGWMSIGLAAMPQGVQATVSTLR